MSQRLKKVIARIALLPFLVAVFYCFLPTLEAIGDTFVEQGAKKQRRIVAPTDDVLDQWITERKVILVREANPQYLLSNLESNTFFINIKITEDLIAMCEKKIEEPYDAGDWGMGDGSEEVKHREKYTKQADELRTALATYRTATEQIVSAAAMRKAVSNHNRSESYGQEMFSKAWFLRWGKVLLSGLLSIIGMGLFMTIYALLKARIYGLRAWLELVSGRAVGVGFTWLITLSRYPSCSPKAQLQTALKFATGWIVLLLSAAPLGMAQGKNSRSSKGRQQYAWIDSDNRARLTNEEVLDDLILKALLDKRTVETPPSVLEPAHETNSVSMQPTSNTPVHLVSNPVPASPTDPIVKQKKSPIRDLLLEYRLRHFGVNRSSTDTEQTLRVIFTVGRNFFDGLFSNKSNSSTSQIAFGRWLFNKKSVNANMGALLGPYGGIKAVTVRDRQTVQTLLAGAKVSLFVRAPDQGFELHFDSPGCQFERQLAPIKRSFAFLAYQAYGRFAKGALDVGVEQSFKKGFGIDGVTGYAGGFFRYNIAKARAFFELLIFGDKEQGSGIRFRMGQTFSLAH